MNGQTYRQLLSSGYDWLRRSACSGDIAFTKQENGSFQSTMQMSVENETSSRRDMEDQQRQAEDLDFASSVFDDAVADQFPHETRHIDERQSK